MISHPLCGWSFNFIVRKFNGNPEVSGHAGSSHGRITAQLMVNLIGLELVKERRNNIRLTWITATEVKNAGFRLWRATKDQYGGYESILLGEFSDSEQVDPEPNEDCSIKIQGQLKVDNSSRLPKLISAVGNSAESTCYSFTDASNLGDGTYYYLLEDIDDDGKSTFHCDHIDAVIVDQGPAIDLPSAINYCKKVTGSEG